MLSKQLNVSVNNSLHEVENVFDNWCYEEWEIVAVEHFLSTASKKLEH